MEYIKKKYLPICCLEILTADLKTHIKCKWRDVKRYSMQMEHQKPRVAIFISDKID